MSTTVYNRTRDLRFEVVSDEHRQHPETSIRLPQRGTSGAGAYDFFSPVAFAIPPQGQVLLWTDVKAKMPRSLMLMLNVRSSMGKHCIRLANTLGWIDGDYADNPTNDGNIGLLLENNGHVPYEVHAGDRIAQGAFVRFYVTDDDCVDTERNGGFGSTGT